MNGMQVRLVLVKDLRRLWPLLLLLGTLTVVAVASLPDAGRILTAEAASTAATQAWDTWATLLVAIIAGILVQQEALNGTTAFWLARPFSRAALLGAKVVFAALFLVLPAVVVQLWLLAGYGLERHLWTGAAAEILLDHAPAVLVAMFVAAVTPNVRTFVVVMILAVVGIGAIDALLSWATANGSTADSLRGRQLVRLGLTAAAAVGLTAYQYATRRTRRARAAGVVAAVIIVVGSSSIGLASPWPAWRPAQAGEVDTEAIRLVVKDSFDDGLGWSISGADEGRELAFALLDVTGLPADHWVSLTHIDSSLAFDDGGRLTASLAPNIGYGSLYPRTVDFPLAGSDEVTESSSLAKLFSLDPDVWRADADRSGTYSGRAVLELMNAREAGAVALAPFLDAPGREPMGFVDGSTEVLVVDALVEGDELTVHIRSRWIQPRFAASPVHFWAVVNRVRGERLALSGSSGHGRGISSIFGGPDIRVDEDLLRARLNEGGVEGGVPVGRAWLADAELVLIVGHAVERLVRHFEIADFRLDAYTREAWSRRRPARSPR